MVSDRSDGKYWGDKLTPRLITGLVVTAIMLGIGLLAIAWGYSEQTNRQWDSDERSGEYTAYTYGPAYDACIRLPTDRQDGCKAKANDERRKNERDEHDLVAQQTSAIWAFLMGAAAIIGMVLSAIGVFLVWTTFNETKHQNTLTKTLGQPDIMVRPTVSIQPYRHDLSQSVSISVNRGGGNHAYDVTCHSCRVTLQNGRLQNFDLEHAEPPRMFNLDSNNINGGGFTFRFPQSKFFQQDIIALIKTWITLDVEFSYKDTFGDTHAAAECYHGTFYPVVEGFDAGPAVQVSAEFQKIDPATKPKPEQ